MRKVKLYFINAIMLASVNIIMRTVAVSFNAYVSNKIGAEAMGVMTLAMSVYGLSVTLATSGINLAAMRLTVETITAYETGKKPKYTIRGVVVACVTYSLILGVCSGGLLFGASGFIAEDLLGDIRTLPSLRALAVSLPFISVSSALGGYFTGARKVYKNVSISLIEQLFKICVTSAGLIAIAPAGIEYACLAVVGGSALAEGISLFSSVMFFLFDKIRRKEKRINSKSPLKERLHSVSSITVPIAVASCMRQGLITLEHMALPRALRKSGASSGDALSSYGTLCGMVMPLIMFPSAVLYAFSNLLIPEMTEFKTVDNYDKIRKVAARVFRASLLFSVAVSGIFITFSYEFGTRIYGSAEAARQIRAIAPLIPIMYLDSSVDGMLKGLGEQVQSMKINIIDAAVSLTLVLLLVPQMGMDGYIVVIYICETLNAVLSIARLIKVTDFKADLLRWLGKPLIGIILSAGIVRLASAYPIPFIGSTGDMPARLLAVSALYVVLMFIFRAIDKNDLRFAADALKR